MCSQVGASIIITTTITTTTTIIIVVVFVIIIINRLRSHGVLRSCKCLIFILVHIYIVYNIGKYAGIRIGTHAATSRSRCVCLVAPHHAPRATRHAPRAMRHAARDAPE
jgi:hypothetical protein